MSQPLSLRYRLLARWAHVVSRHPWLVLIVAGLITAAAVGVTLAKLQFNPNRNDLISPDLDWNQRFIAWVERFPSSSDLIVVVDTMANASPPSEEAHYHARMMVDELAGRLLAADDAVERVVWGFDPRAFSPRAARLLSADQLASQLQQVEKSRMMLDSPSLEALIRASIAEAQTAMAAPAAAQANTSQDELTDAQVAATAADIDDMRGLFHAVERTLATPVDQAIDFEALVAGDAAQDTWQYLTSGNGRLYFIRITPKLQEGSLSAFTPAIRAIREILQDVGPRHPQVEAGLTGIDVVESDETDAATWDSAWTTATAAVLIAILLVSAFHSWRIPLLAMTALAMAIGCAFGFLTITIGHLQVLSVVFTLILLGLGIDYAIHFSTTFELIRHDHPDNIDGFARTLTDTLQRTGPPLMTGALTTAAAFITTLFTDFTGVAEMGIVASAGIVLCLLSMVSVYPALLRLCRPRHRHIRPPRQRHIHYFDERWVTPFIRYPRTTLAVTAALLGLSILAMTQMRFDYDLLKLQPRGVDSVLWQQRIVDRGEESIWFGVSVVDDLEEARRLATAYRNQPLVADKLGGIGLLFPTQESEKLAMLAHTRDALAPALAQAATPTSEGDAPPATGQGLSVQMALLKQVLPMAMGRDMPAPIRDSLARLQTTLDQAAQRASALPPDELAARLARVEREYAHFRHHTAARLSVMLDGRPLTLDDLPAELTSAYISDEGKLSLEMYPQLPPDAAAAGPLHPRFLPRFIDAITSVDPNVTGVIVQIYRSGHLIKTAYQFAGIAAFIAVLLLVWVEFRSWYDSVLTLIPVAVGFGITFGLMWLTGMPINPANIIVLPLMFGLGVDAGVHMIHRYRDNPAQRPIGLTQGTGKGIALTSYTTMIGFGVMCLASHRGISSLGFVLCTGIGMTLLACWTMLAAWLELRRQRIERLQGVRPSRAG